MLIYILLCVIGCSRDATPFRVPFFIKELLVLAYKGKVTDKFWLSFE